ncbi:cupin domain-containing protein [Aliibacillus thermotolerans]|uniref:Cupin domain-containing protein n=1 Tax=Aliibacillus thermotolerans TaxID=1834418 RepID=A0ABW0U616_9BACI|nr:cupin domain-containing protein [Aliibacillus thermotolerans]MDA3130105.1 hypothetical protein [Aliibacillus thermotolerans]
MKNEEVTPMFFQPQEHIPNNKEIPVLLYSGVMSEKTEKMRDTFHQNNWTNSWLGSLHEEDHFHSNTHEVIGIYNGSGRIRLGGAKGTYFDVMKGDVLVIPAGVCHRLMSASFDFAVIGAYPDGKEYNHMTGEEKEMEEWEKEISKVPLPKTDPVFGKEGPLIRAWIRKSI